MNRVDILERLLTKPEFGDTCEIARHVEAASLTRMTISREMLASRFGQEALGDLGRGAFREVVVSHGDISETLLTREEFVEWVAREPRTVSSPGMGGLAELEFRDERGRLSGSAFGHRLEPDAEIYMIHTGLLLAGLTGQIAIGARHLDRSFPRLGDLCEDLVTVTHADTFTKLFLAAGELSRTGWHRDPQDVLVTMVWGRKRFQVAAASVEGDDPSFADLEIDVELAVGDCLLLPEGRLHRAVPNGAESGLMSIALLRRINWIGRRQVPYHIGVDDHPPSDDIYGKMLRPRRAEYHELFSDTWYRVASPGGIHVVAEAKDGLILMVGGLLFHVDAEEAIDLCALLTSGGEYGRSSRLDAVISVMNQYGLLRRIG